MALKAPRYARGEINDIAGAHPEDGELPGRVGDAADGDDTEGVIGADQVVVFVPVDKSVGATGVGVDGQVDARFADGVIVAVDGMLLAGAAGEDAATGVGARWVGAGGTLRAKA